MHDRLSDGRGFSTFNVLDDYNREGLGIEVDLGLPALRIIRMLDQVIEWRGKLKVIRSDNGSEMCSGEIQTWAKKRNIRLQFIQPGKPTQNAYVERFNRTTRHEWLDEHLFESIDHAQKTATEWLWRYNNERPNMALGGITPRQKLVKVAKINLCLLLGSVINGGITVVAGKLASQDIARKTSIAVIPQSSINRLPYPLKLHLVDLK